MAVRRNEVYPDAVHLPGYLSRTEQRVLADRCRAIGASGQDAEASSVGIRPQLVRLIVICAASLGTAAAVSVSGLIAFVGIIVPHTVRLLAGSSNRIVLPLSMMFGASFLMFVDLLGRTIASPAEIPIGVITAFCGAPFFVVVLRASRRSLG